MVEELILNHMGIKRIADVEEIRKSSNLTKLSLQTNKITEIEGLERLKSLKSLNLSMN